MKRLLIVTVLGIMLGVWIVGCSTISAYKNPDSTPAQKKAALCSDAIMGYNLSTAVMNTQSMTPEQAKYWDAYKLGAALALKTYCPAQ